MTNLQNSILFLLWKKITLNQKWAKYVNTMCLDIHVVPVDFMWGHANVRVDFYFESLQLAQQFSFLVIFMFHCILQTAPRMNVFHVLNH